MQVKILCGCGQKYAFDVEPVSGKMPCAVQCPSCGADGTRQADGIIAQAISGVAATPSAAPPAPTRPGAVRVNAPTAIIRPAVVPAALAPQPAPAPARTQVAPTPPAPRRQEPKEFSLPLGVLGALLGAGVGAGLMFGFSALAGFRFPLFGVAIGALSGLGARVLSRGTDLTLGAITAVIAAVAVFGSLYVLFGEFAILNLISVVVSVSVAYRIASG